MSEKAQTKWLATVLVAVISAAVGFGAVYVITAGGDNQASQVEATAAPTAGAGGGQVTPDAGASAKAGEAKPAVEAAEKAEAQKSEAAIKAAAGPGAGPKGPDGEPLNRGRMATFVFKSAPHELPEGVSLQ